MKNTSVYGKTFFYQKGPIVTTLPWSRPDHLKMRAFFEDIRDNTSIMERYDLYILGGVLWDYKNTWDLDINITGPIENYIKLEEDFSKLYDLALNKHKILIDVSWVSERPLDRNYEELENSNFMGEDIDSIRFSYTKKQIGDVLNEIDLSILAKEEDRITNNLVKNNWSNWKIKKGLVDKLKNISPKKAIITYPVETFLNNNDEHYYLNIN
jgi:hypothetical protein